MNARPYILRPHSQLDAYRRKAEAALQAWRANWAPAVEVSIDCVEASDAAPAERQRAATRYALGGDAAAYCIAPPALQAWLGQCLFAASPETRRTASPGGGIPGALATRALRALVEDMLAAIVGRPATQEGNAPLPAGFADRGAGSVAYLIETPAGTLALYVPAHGPAPVPRAVARPVPQRWLNAVSHRRLRLSARLAPVQVTLATLHGLHVHDVLSLPVPLDAPLEVRGPDGALVCHAYLGVLGRFRAVELIQPLSSSSTVAAMRDVSAPSTHIIELPELEGTTAPGSSILSGNLDVIGKVQVKLAVRVGEAEVSIGDLMNMKENQVFKLDAALDTPVDILLEGSVVARGTLVAVDDCFGVRVTELPRSTP